MGRESFARYLAGLDEQALVRLLRARRDVRRAPLPSDFNELAQRLTTLASISTAMQSLARDVLTLGSCVAVLGAAATMPALVELLDAPRQRVRAALGVLFERGLAWESGGVIRLPGPLARTWTMEIGGRGDSDAAAESMPELRSLVARIDALPDRLRDALYQVRHPASYFGGELDPDGSLTAGMLAQGLVTLNEYGYPELSRSVLAAMYVAEHRPALAPAPVLPPARIDAAAANSAGQAAAEQLLRWMTALLDRAKDEPVVALRKGGIGVRERTRLATALSIPDQPLLLCLDLAYVTGLLGHGAGQYAPSDAYDEWREGAPGRQWAVLADAWLGIGHAPTYRDIDEGSEVPPPLQMQPYARWTRRVLLTVATGGDAGYLPQPPTGGASVSAVAGEIGWYAPRSVFPEPRRSALIAAIVREGEWLGVLAGDRVTELGEHLVAGLDAETEDPVPSLAEAAAPLLPESPCTVILQSDLTATVSGRPSSAVSRLLAVAADAEVRGVASVWRFGPASIRAALDAGWGAAALLDELASMSGQPVPPALAYLVNDTARRHGHIRVREVGSCLVADEPLVAELLHTRALRRLEFTELAPTVLSSPKDSKEVLAQLRAAGFAPRAESEDGTVIVETRRAHRTVGVRRGRARSAVAPAAEVARRLRGTGYPRPPSPTIAKLAGFGARLDDAELKLLAHAVDHHHDVLITYRDEGDTVTQRVIRPVDIFERWIKAYCHVIDDQREFILDRIEAVHSDG